jgi:hypothetical protein
MCNCTRIPAVDAWGICMLQYNVQCAKYTREMRVRNVHAKFQHEKSTAKSQREISKRKVNCEIPARTPCVRFQRKSLM